MKIQTFNAGKSSASPAIVKPTVHEQSSQTVVPINQAAEDLADDVIAGVKKISTILDKIVLLFEMFDEGERDSHNRLKVPIKGCYTKQEFCDRWLDRNIRTIQKTLAAVNKSKLVPEEQEAAKKPVTKSGPGSTSHVNESHPQYQAMKAKGLLNDETEVEVEEVDVPEPSAKEKITIKRKDGSIIEEATYAVDDAVRQIVAFATSCLKYMNAAEKTEVIDGVIEKLRSERDFIHKDTPIVIEEPAAVQQ
jgi:hypothetical protein